MVLDSKVVQTVQISWSAILLLLSSSAKQNKRRVATDLQSTWKETKSAQSKNGNFHDQLVVESTTKLIWD